MLIREKSFVCKVFFPLEGAGEKVIITWLRPKASKITTVYSVGKGREIEQAFRWETPKCAQFREQW